MRHSTLEVGDLWEAEYFNLEIVSYARVLSAARVCERAIVGGWAGCPRTAANSNKRGAATRNARASTNPPPRRQNWSFVNHGGINHHHSFWEQEKPEGLLNYSVFVSKEQTPHRD